MKIKIILINLFVFFMSMSLLFADEIEFDANKMEIKDNGNLILAFDVELIIPGKNLSIKSNRATYNKINNIIIFEENVYFQDTNNNTVIEGKKATYERNKDLIYTDGLTKINLNKKYNINSTNVYYDRKIGKIYGDEKTFINDYKNNIYELTESFTFDIPNELIKSKKSIITDKDKNKYIFENLLINLKNNEIAGKEIKVEFVDNYFGNKKNDPRLNGRSGYSNDNELRIYKSVFSTCNIENKSCRGWELNADEFNHDKKNKIFEYKNSWLEIMGYKVFFLPYFNHPDPSVKRKSGFLTPSYSASTSLGTSVNIPYFKVIADDRDITFNPRYYADKSFLLQNEYRQVLKDSEIISDFSFMFGEAGTKGHFFYNQFGKFSNTLNYEINLQNVEGDNYLKKYDLKENSKLIKNDNLLSSNLDLFWNFSDSNLSTSFKVFEDLTRNHNDRYQFIFPDFNFSKNIDIPDSYDGKFNFNSYGYNNHYNTNIIESVITNDFLFSSNQYINNLGLVLNYDLLLKNSNSYAKNSNSFKEDENYDLFSTIKIDTSFPLQKQTNKYKNFLTPKLSFRYSPDRNSNLSAKNLLLNYNNVFGLNRIGTSHEVEGGESLSLGLEYKKNKLDGFNIFDLRLANNLRLNENNNLPLKSKLNKTRSDIFGNFNFNFNDDFKIGYFFSYDRDLEYSNLEQVNLEYGVNNFFTNFSYYTEDNDFGDKENIKNISGFKFNKENKLRFETAKDLKDDFTQYYNLVYTYETDCISINFNYNKSFFRDGNLEPNRSLSFLIKIIPFTELGVPNIGRIIRN
ncbi:LPS export ABC transporter periplasmic protein LptC [Candidatus Pelagibacter sp.]|nr:LPS export ABC transporter periplasmic protein LptC [Candidatus Pelagibacter sp.]